MPMIKLLSPQSITLQVGGEDVVFEAGAEVEVSEELHAELLARNPTDKTIKQAIEAGDQVWAEPVAESGNEGGE